eukprot:1181637-Prorocentrum_minimum.AAC.1
MFVWAVCVDMWDQAPELNVGQPCGGLSAGNIHRIFGGIFEMLRTEWYTRVDSRRLSTVELKSKAFLAVDSGAFFMYGHVGWAEHQRR